MGHPNHRVAGGGEVAACNLQLLACSLYIQELKQIFLYQLFKDFVVRKHALQLYAEDVSAAGFQPVPLAPAEPESEARRKAPTR